MKKMQDPRSRMQGGGEGLVEGVGGDDSGTLLIVEFETGWCL